MRESDLVIQILDFYKSKRWRVCTEIAFFHRSIDIVIRKGKTIWAIEAKISSIQKGLHQCRILNMGADRVYLALPEKKLRDESWEKINKAYYAGLMFVDKKGDIQIVKEFERRDEIYDVARVRLENNFEHALRFRK